MKFQRLISCVLVFAVLAISASLYVPAVAANIDFISADDSEYFYTNRYDYSADTVNGAKFAVGNLGDLRWDRVSIYDFPAGVYNNRWPYIAFKVKATVEGEYTVTTKLATRTDTKAFAFNMIVDGISNAVKFNLDSKGFATPVSELYLTAGEHIIVCTSPMPEFESKAPTATGDAYSYPWCDFYSFKFSQGLTAVTAPTQQEINGAVATRIEAEDMSRVLYNLGYDSVGTLAKGAKSADVKQSFDDLENGLLDKTKMPYIEYRINAPEAGPYNVRLGSSVGGSEITNLPFATVIVNDNAYKAQYSCNFASGASDYDDVNLVVSLNKGVNLVKITTVTNDQVSFGKDYLNHDYLEISQGLTAEVVITKVEAENKEYAVWNLYNKTESGGTGTVVGGVSKGNIKQSYSDLEVYLDKKTTPYIQYTVDAPETGNYDVIPGYLAGTSGNQETLQKPFATVLVNGEKAYKAQFNANWGTVGNCPVSVELKKGINIIRVTSITTDQNSFSVTTWINQDYILLDSRLTPVKAGEVSTFNFTDDKVEHNIYTVKDDNNGLRLGGLSSNYLGDGKTYVNVITNGDLTYIPYAAFKLVADKDGCYDITFNVTSKATDGRTQCVAMLTDGEVKPLKFRATGNAKLDATMFLTSGEHIIVLTPPMPYSAETATGVSGDDFPWFDYCDFNISSGLTLGNKPTDKEILCDFKIRNIGDETKVFINRFTDKGDTLGSAVLGDMRWDRPSVETLTTYNLNRMPYAAIRVETAEDGEYTFKLAVSVNTNATSNNIAMMVDGKENYAAPIASKEAKATLKLTKGEHIVVFTTPMPLTDEEAQALKRDDANAYAWLDMLKLYLPDGVEISELPTRMEIETPLIAYDDAYTRIEAENSDYVVYRGYESKPEANSSASDGNVIGGVKKYLITEKFDDLSEWVDGSNGHIPYVEYVVEAPADGEYDIRVGVLADASKRDGIPKPYAAVIANEKVYKVQYNNIWAKSEALKLTVSLNKGRNIIRCTGLTKEQDIYKTGYWINQDFIDIDKSLKPVKRSYITAEAENSAYTNLFKIQDGTKDEMASGNKVLGGANTKRVAATNMTLDKFTYDDMKIVPYFSYTVEAPMDGYYNMGVLFAGDGRLFQSRFALIVDNEVKELRYSRNDKFCAANETTGIVYFSKGRHTVTVTSPLPANSEERAVYSYRWINFDCIKFYDGIKVSKEQLPPNSIPDFVRYEAEDYGLPNMTKITDSKGASGDKIIGNAYYGRAQSANDIMKKGVDLKTMPAVQYIINAKQSGTYTFYFSQNAGIYKDAPNVSSVNVAICCNKNVQIVTTDVAPNVTTYRLICAKLKLDAGTNTVTITHSTSDSYTDSGYAWVDYDYIEIDGKDADKISFRKNTNIIEAEKSEFEGYTPVENSSASGGKYLGKGVYGTVDLNQITFEKLDPKNLGELPRVSYTVNAVKEGDYDVAVLFSGGSTTYTFDQLVKKGTIGFAVAVNGENKQLVEFCPGVGSKFLSRIVRVHLNEGPNEITVTCPLAEYMSGVNPRVEENYKLYWMDQDALLLTEGLSADDEVSAAGVENSDINYAQLKVKKANAHIDTVMNTEKISIVAIVALISLAVLVLAGAGITVWVIAKHKKKTT